MLCIYIYILISSSSHIPKTIPQAVEARRRRGRNTATGPYTSLCLHFDNIEVRVFSWKDSQYDEVPSAALAY